jgi:response regulator RpfG family c-di-GMP phosphodiesterase
VATRKTFLVIEPQPSEGISVRKLLLETAFYNVLTGYSGDEGIKLLGDFPNVDAAVVHSDIKNPAGATVVGRLKEMKPEMPLIFITPNGAGTKTAADAVVSSHEPRQLLSKLEEIVGPAKEPPETH